MSLQWFEAFYFWQLNMRSQNEARRAFVDVVTAVFMKLAVSTLLAIFIQRILVVYSQEMCVLLNAFADFLHLNLLTLPFVSAG
jgi:hypothetical protein